MMGRNDRFPEGYSTAFHPNYESEGSGSSARLDAEITASEDSIAPRQKWIDLNSASRGGFDVPVQVVPLSKLSPSEKKTLVLRFRSELEKIRVLQKKFEVLRTKTVTVSSSSDILSCSNVQRGPTVSKRSSGLVSGPGKKSNSSGNKARGWNRGCSGRFESAKQGFVPSLPSLHATMMKQCESLLKKLMSHQYAWVFNTPVDTVQLNIPDYFTVIKHPMDLGTIKSKLVSGQYLSPLEFFADVKLTFSNAMTYNPPGNNVHVMADTMSKFFEVRWKAIEKKLPANMSLSLPEKSGLHEEAEVVKPTAPAKKRKLSPSHHAVIQEPDTTRMTDEEKCNLSRELESMLGDLSDNIIEFFREQISNVGESGEDEIEIDIYDLSDDALFTLRKLLDEHLQEKQKNGAKAEPCEIELPNESGLSSSSMQVDKGNDVDVDVDIGGNEGPVSSYPAVEIERDAGLRSNRSDGKSGFSLLHYDLGNKGPSDGEVEIKASSTMKPTLEHCGSARVLHDKEGADDLAEGNQSVSGLDQLEQSSQEKPNSDESDSRQDGESAPTERQVSPEKLYRAALLKNRFADTILKAREKTLVQGEKGDPEKLRLEREKLDMQKMREKARLQAEAKAAEDARRRAEEEAAAEARRKREIEREAARQALLQIEKTVEINENSQFLEDLEMLRAGPLEQLPSSVDEASPDHLQKGFGSFKFGGNNPLEQLGLYMKVDDDDEEGDPTNAPDSVNDDVEEGEID